MTSTTVLDECSTDVLQDPEQLISDILSPEALPLGSLVTESQIRDFADDSLLSGCDSNLVLTNSSADYGLIEEVCEFYSVEEFLDKEFYKPFHGLVGKPGLCSIPGVVAFVESLLSACSMAQEKRRSNEIKSVGISMPDLRDHILANFPEAREKFPHLGTSTVRRLGLPPHKGRRAARYYHCAIPMKKFRVENNRFAFTEHSHSAFAQLNLIFEQCASAQTLGDRVVIYSSDVSQSLLVGGTTLTSRYHQNRKILTSDFPGTPAHDFVTIGKIRPYGYLELKNSSTGSRYNDILGRTHVLVPHEGHLNIYLRASHPNIQFYLNDIIYSLKKKYGDSVPSFIVNCSDRGTGWDLHSELTFVFFGRYWKDAKLTGLVQMSPAEHMSAFNKIEREFSSFHDHLSGVVANDKLNGVVPTDSEQKGKLLDEAMDLVCELENGRKISCEKVCS